jgi:hypothetical protein
MIRLTVTAGQQFLTADEAQMHTNLLISGASKNMKVPLYGA